MYFLLFFSQLKRVFNIYDPVSKIIYLFFYSWRSEIFIVSFNILIRDFLTYPLLSSIVSQWFVMFLFSFSFLLWLRVFSRILFNRRKSSILSIILHYMRIPVLKITCLNRLINDLCIFEGTFLPLCLFFPLTHLISNDMSLIYHVVCLLSL